MPSALSGITSGQLRRAADIKVRIESLQAELDQILSGSPKSVNESATSGRRKMSATSRARIAAAQRARWAKAKRATQASKPVTKKRKKMSAAGRERMAAAARARWAKAKASGRNAL
jgi:hypothetical protein